MRVCEFRVLVLSSCEFRTVTPRMAAFEAAMSVKSLPVMPRRTSLRGALASFQRARPGDRDGHFELWGMGWGWVGWLMETVMLLELRLARAGPWEPPKQASAQAQSSRAALDGRAKASQSEAKKVSMFELALTAASD